jgi:hypothetical protein
MRVFPQITFFVASILASVSYAHELGPIPENAGLGIAAVSMNVAMVCDLQFKRPEMVRDAKALFLKFAKKELKHPEVSTERAFAYLRRHVTRKQLAQYHKQTPESCDEFSRMFRRELSR